jgi:aspartyl-tRNA(Asn)/glutamyl-tRNA(Gln) amidotransferase subunit A
MELADLTAEELGQRIACLEVSPVEVLDAVLERIDALDGRLHAFTGLTEQRAREEAALAERDALMGRLRGPLHGVPYAVKDLFDVAGENTGAGSRVRADHRADGDAFVVARAAEAGMVLVGKTHTVQFAFGGVGINHDTGTPHNPHFDAPHATGGSSSGSAVAVAASMVPIALGTDTGGSVRTPAALCGIVGLKTTVGRVSRAGVYPLSQTLDSVGPLARTSIDAALMYDVIHGPDAAGDRSTLGIERDELTATLDRGLDGLHLAFGEGLLFDGVDPEIEAAVRATAATFGQLGCEVGSVEFTEASEVVTGIADQHRALLIAAEACVFNHEYLEYHFDELDPIVSHRMIRGRELSAVDYLDTIAAWAAARDRMVARLADVDAILVPTTMQQARPIGEIDVSPESYARFNGEYLRNTTVGNRLGLCGVSVPCGTTATGAPIGLMIYAKPFREDIAMRVAAAYQSATEGVRLTP